MKLHKSLDYVKNYKYRWWMGRHSTYYYYSNNLKIGYKMFLLIANNDGTSSQFRIIKNGQLTINYKWNPTLKSIKKLL